MVTALSQCTAHGEHARCVNTPGLLTSAVAVTHAPEDTLPRDSAFPAQLPLLQSRFEARPSLSVQGKPLLSLHVRCKSIC